MNFRIRKARLRKCKRCKTQYRPGVCEDRGLCERCIRELCEAGTPPPCVLAYRSYPIFE